MKLGFQHACSAVLLVAASLAYAQAPVEIAPGDARSHRLPREDFVRRPRAGVFKAITVRIEVDTSGRVTAATATDGPEELRDPALALAKAWRYTPFERDGQAVPAVFDDYVSILPPERPPARQVAFPTVQDWSSVKITLRRTACFGTCPAYRVEIDGSGDVIFSDSGGERRRQISREALEGLVEVFRKADYYSLDNVYRLGATDLPTYITSISIDGQSMSVSDYAGLQVGMPASVRDVEEAIDEAAGTREWLKSPR